MLLHPQGQIIDVKWVKSQKIDHCDFFSAIIEFVGELVTSNMRNKFDKYMKNLSRYSSHKVKLLTENEKNRNQPFRFFFSHY